MASTDVEPDLAPELLVSSIARSLELWCGLCGFQIAYERPEGRLAYVTRGNAHVMLDQHGVSRNWLTDELEPPFGCGTNLQIGVPGLVPNLSGLADAALPLFMPPETNRYRVNGGEEAGVRQFPVTDPDG